MFICLCQVLLLVTVTTCLPTAELWTKTLTLNDGNEIPIVSFGTFGRIADLNLIKPAVIKAIESGYRHIDTAAAYRNEEHIGEAIADVISRGIVTREELFITTKISTRIGTREGVRPALEESLQKLKLDYINLYLIHNPMNLMNVSYHDYLDVWKGMEDVKKLNLARSIGVSNFETFQLNRVLANSDIRPAVNQIEVHPVHPNLNLVSFCQNLDITVMSYAPFGYMVKRPWIKNLPISTFDEPILRKLAQKYSKFPSQVVLRYLIDRGTVVIPRSTNMMHIETNINVFDFKLTAAEIKKVNELNKDAKVYLFDPESLASINEYFGFT